MLKKLKEFLDANTRYNEANVQSMTQRESRHNVEPSVKVSLFNGLNGRVLEVSTHAAVKSGNFVHSEWTHEFYTISEGETLSSAIATALAMKDMSK